MDHAVADTIQRIALVEDRLGDQDAIARRENLRNDRPAGRVARCSLVESDFSMRHANTGERWPHRRRAGDHPVEELWVALRRQHAFAPTGRAAHDIAVMRGLTVIDGDHCLGGGADGRHRMQREIERRALILHECVVEHRIAGMAAVGRNHREAARDRGHLAGRRGTECRIDGAVEAPAALEQEAAVPVIRQCQLEPEPIGDAVHALARIDHALDFAVARNSDTDRGRKRVWTHSAGRRIGHAPGLGDSKIVAGEREAFQSADRIPSLRPTQAPSPAARPRVSSWLRQSQ